jgi:hypothetical protein
MGGAGAQEIRYRATIDGRHRGPSHGIQAHNGHKHTAFSFAQKASWQNKSQSFSEDDSSLWYTVEHNDTQVRL